MNLTQTFILVPHPWIAISFTVQFLESLIIFSKLRLLLFYPAFYFLNLFINNLNLYIGIPFDSDDNVKLSLFIGEGEATLFHILLTL